MDRRKFFLGLAAAFAAPAIVRAESIMKVAMLRESVASSVVVEPGAFVMGDSIAVGFADDGIHVAQGALRTLHTAYFDVAGVRRLQRVVFAAGRMVDHTDVPMPVRRA